MLMLFVFAFDPVHFLHQIYSHRLLLLWKHTFKPNLWFGSMDVSPDLWCDRRTGFSWCKPRSRSCFFMCGRTYLTSILGKSTLRDREMSNSIMAKTWCWNSWVWKSLTEMLSSNEGSTLYSRRRSRNTHTIKINNQEWIWRWINRCLPLRYSLSSYDSLVYIVFSLASLWFKFFEDKS